MVSVKPLNIYYSPQPDCNSCIWNFFKVYRDLKGESILAIFGECTLGLMPNLQLCDDYQKEDDCGGLIKCPKCVERIIVEK